MTTDSPEPCPCEANSPENSPGAVADAEGVIRFVPYRNWLLRNGEGGLVLTEAAFPREELEGKGGKSASILRDMTKRSEIARRAAHRNREPEWETDAVLAYGRVSAVRSLHDDAGRREVCLSADPITDELGYCPTHANILRAVPPLDRTQRLHWKKLRLALAFTFTDIAHVSGNPVSGV